MPDNIYKRPPHPSQPTRLRSVFFELFLLAKEKERLEAEKNTWQARIAQIDARLKVINSQLATLEPQIHEQLGIMVIPENC